MLGQRRGRWPSIKPPSCGYLVFAGNAWIVCYHRLFIWSNLQVLTIHRITLFDYSKGADFDYSEVAGFDYSKDKGVDFGYSKVLVSLVKIKALIFKSEDLVRLIVSPHHANMYSAVIAALYE